jgi:hypothetical protein
MDLPTDESIRWIVTHCARLRAAHGAVFADVPLVEPTAAFFPDAFTADLPGVGRLLRRMISYAPISDGLPVELGLLLDDEGAAGGCGSGACGSGARLPRGTGRVEEVGDGYRILIDPGAVGHPDLLAASLARGIGALVRLEAGERGGADAEAEVAAVTCGFGALLLNGAAVWAKSCGGLRMARATALSASEIAIALAIFLVVHGHAEARCRAHLGPTQREALDRALEWAASNDRLLEALRDRPALLEGGVFDLEPVRGPLSRWLHRRRAERVERIRPAAPRPALTEAQKRRLDEARTLVDEVFGTE